MFKNVIKVPMLTARNSGYRSVDMPTFKTCAPCRGPRLLVSVLEAAPNARKARGFGENGVSCLRLARSCGPFLNEFSLRLSSLRCLKQFSLGI